MRVSTRSSTQQNLMFSPLLFFLQVFCSETIRETTFGYKSLISDPKLPDKVVAKQCSQGSCSHAKNPAY